MEFLSIDLVPRFKKEEQKKDMHELVEFEMIESHKIFLDVVSITYIAFHNGFVCCCFFIGYTRAQKQAMPKKFPNYQLYFI
jgi:hypothetical protein